MLLAAWARLSVALALTTIGVDTFQSRPVATPVVVELFTSEGCSDCPPADAVLEKLISTQPVAGTQVIGLGEHVDYWDQQGWKDRFASAALTARQQMYGAHFRLDSVYTPQMIVDGRAQFVGSDAKAAVQAIQHAAAAPHASVTLAIEPRAARLFAVAVNVRDNATLSRGDRADVVVALVEDRLRTEVTGGENRGRTLTHAAVVRSATTIGKVAAGDWSVRGDVTIAAEWKRDDLTFVAFVQEPRGRAILGAAAMPLSQAR